MITLQTQGFFVTYGMFICPALIIEDINIDIVECDLLDNIILYWDQYFILDKPLLFTCVK